MLIGSKCDERIWTSYFNRCCFTRTTSSNISRPLPRMKINSVQLEGPSSHPASFFQGVFNNAFRPSFLPDRRTDGRTDRVRPISTDYSSWRRRRRLQEAISDGRRRDRGDRGGVMSGFFLQQRLPFSTGDGSEKATAYGELRDI